MAIFNLLLDAAVPGKAYFGAGIGAGIAALAAGVGQDAAELIAGKAALGNMAYFPLALIFLFGILFVFRKNLEKNRIPQTA